MSKRTRVEEELPAINAGATLDRGSATQSLTSIARRCEQTVGGPLKLLGTSRRDRLVAGATRT